MKTPQHLQQKKKCLLPGEEALNSLNTLEHWPWIASEQSSLALGRREGKCNVRVQQGPVVPLGTEHDDTARDGPESWAGQIQGDSPVSPEPRAPAKYTESWGQPRPAGKAWQCPQPARAQLGQNRRAASYDIVGATSDSPSWAELQPWAMYRNIRGTLRKGRQGQ